MDFNESSPLLSAVSQRFEENKKEEEAHGLSLFFAVICIVDVFGVFPIVALPKAIIQCGKITYLIFFVLITYFFIFRVVWCTFNYFCVFFTNLYGNYFGKMLGDS